MQIRAKIGTGPVLNYRLCNKHSPPIKNQIVRVYEDRDRVTVRVVSIDYDLRGLVFTLERT